MSVLAIPSVLEAPGKFGEDGIECCESAAGIFEKADEEESIPDLEDDRDDVEQTWD